VAGFVADIGDARGCDALVAAHPTCDILVDNLGIYGERDFLEIPDSEWLRFFEANVMSGVRLSRAYLPAMIRGWGRVVFISSKSALNIPADMIVAGTGVTVNSVLLGPTLSEGVAKMLKDTMVTGRSLEDAGAAFVSVVDHPACGERRGSCQHNRLCLLAAGLRDHGRGAACRRRRRRHHRLRVRHERAWRSLTRRSDAPDSARL
jgi:short chain dehydrogenase